MPMISMQNKISSCLIEIDIQKQSALWDELDFSCENYIEEIMPVILKDGFKAVGKKADQEGEISIVLADDAFIKKLNHDYRDKEKPTNVLSFPQTEIEEFDADAPYILLGDIIIAFETIARECVEQNKSFKNHFTHMLVHGTLHLMHFDHIDDEDAEEMESLEIEILEGLSIKNPYEMI